MALEFHPIAHIRSDFPQKFGVPRQSGLVSQLRAEVVFDGEFATTDAVRGLDEFSHLWLIWVFSHNVNDNWTPTVRPPRLKGERRGVFATRSPLRPNPIGLSSVELLSIRIDSKRGPILEVAGADLVDGTPILDIKPYLPADVHSGANFGYVTNRPDDHLEVDIPDHMLQAIPADKLDALRGILAQDPRPSFHDDPHRIYGLAFAGVNVRFQVHNNTARVLVRYGQHTGGESDR